MSESRISLTRSDRTTVCECCYIARTRIERGRGLLGRKGLAGGEGLLFPRTRAVHTHFMRFAIDVVFLDHEGEVVRVVPALGPWRAASCRRADSVLELAAGECARIGLVEGDRVNLGEAA